MATNGSPNNTIDTNENKLENEFQPNKHEIKIVF